MQSLKMLLWIQDNVQDEGEEEEEDEDQSGLG
jgi:hypothetical protein